MAKVQIPVHALIRPRGGDFLYTTDEFECMCLDATLLLNAGAAGIVVGCLHVNGSVDIPRIERMVEIAGHRQVTFHRGFWCGSSLITAIDVARDAIKAVSELADVGVTRILTRFKHATILTQCSGQARSAAEGIDLLSKMIATVHSSA
jgi:copper homeostasis protein